MDDKFINDVLNQLNEYSLDSNEIIFDLATDVINDIKKELTVTKGKYRQKIRDSEKEQIKLLAENDELVAEIARQKQQTLDITKERDILAEAFKLGNSDLIEWFMMSYERCYWTEEVRMLGEDDIALNNDLEKHAFLYAIAEHKLTEED